jgi:predicted Ser/Thr protein kinase
MQTVVPVILGDYEIVAELGRGAMGVVYQARQRSLGRLVALKMVLNTQVNPGMLERFKQEARSAATLDHPGIVPLFEFGEADGQPYYTMAFVEGDTLSGLVRGQGPLPPARAAHLLAQVADAVACAHERGIIHRDLKPDNVLVDRQGHARITDFGLARRLEDGPNLTAPGSVMGTPSYMAPEQAQGLTELTPAVDVYALGAMLHAVLAGQSPFSGTSVYEVLLKVTREPPPPLRQVKADLPEALERIVLRCLEKDPARRYASAADVAADLRAWLASEPGEPRALARGGERPRDLAEPTERIAAPPRAGRGRRLVLAGVVLLLAAGAVLGWHLYQRSTNSQANPEEVGGEWPRPARQDFPLTVSLEGVRPDAKEIYRLSAGQPVRIVIESPRDVYVVVSTTDENGNPIQLFPNEWEKDNLVRAGVRRTIPGTDEYDIPAAPASRVEFIRVVATTEKPAPLPGKLFGGGFALFEGKDRQRWERQRRGLMLQPRKQVKKAEGLVSEAILPYHVRAAR